MDPIAAILSILECGAGEVASSSSRSHPQTPNYRKQKTGEEVQEDSSLRSSRSCASFAGVGPKTLRAPRFCFETASPTT